MIKYEENEDCNNVSNTINMSLSNETKSKTVNKKKQW